MDVILQFLLTQYGLTGLCLALVLFLLWRSNKKCDDRLKAIEKKDEEKDLRLITSQKEMVDDYVQLVKHNTEVISNLTSCINAMSDALKRIEFKQDSDKNR